MASSFGVSIEKKQALNSRMRRLGILEDDLTEKFIKGSGPGGQKINKTSACVYLMHETSRIEVKCQQTRSQALNRYYARVILCDELEHRILQEKSKREREREKIRRQKLKRSKRAQEKVLKEKKIRGEQKVLRRRKTDE